MYSVLQTIAYSKPVTEDISVITCHHSFIVENYQDQVKIEDTIFNLMYVSHATHEQPHCY